MNRRKRKADNPKQSTKRIDNESKTLDIHASNFSESVNSTDQQKSDNGRLSEQPGTSDDRISEEETNDISNQLLEQSEEKHIRLEGSKKAGVLLFTGGTNWDLIGRKELPKHAKGAVGDNLLGPHRIASLQGIKVTSVFSSCCAAHSVIIVEGDKAYTWGRNDYGQLGHCDTTRRNIPTMVETLKDTRIVSAACGRSHTLFISEGGIVYSTGDNKMGQCGIGSQNTTINIPTKVKFKQGCITKVACGAQFSLIVDTKGGLYSFGCPEYGQLGHNSDGKYFVTSNKISFRCELVPRRVVAFIEKTSEGHVSLVDDVQITNIACGVNHSVVVDTQKRCFSFGFGGYGRLGHAEPRDEMVPRLIKAFDSPRYVRGVKDVFAGGSYSMAVNEYGLLYIWGQQKKNRRSNDVSKTCSRPCGVESPWCCML